MVIWRSCKASHHDLQSTLLSGQLSTPKMSHGPARGQAKERLAVNCLRVPHCCQRLVGKHARRASMNFPTTTTTSATTTTTTTTNTFMTDGSSQSSTQTSKHIPHSAVGGTALAQHELRPPQTRTRSHIDAKKKKRAVLRCHLAFGFFDGEKTVDCFFVHDFVLIPRKGAYGKKDIQKKRTFFEKKKKKKHHLQSINTHTQLLGTRTDALCLSVGYMSWSSHIDTALQNANDLSSSAGLAQHNHLPLWRLDRF
ncbi:hypothetical protein BD289DRAFT_35171 [Coniella lustricola]|uniref:Uncharacterized protein n=1 Tax=Coniella lustricola TaxID=2025994 RepID=A0A2T3A2C1_9PEZI|nr:hypothetical protein BD289DRAFT_35171 [Coniella lustricola]